MKKVCIQVGHWNIENIGQKGLRRWRAWSELRKSTGASGERKWHWEEWMPRLRDKLIRAGIQVHIVDSIWNDQIYSQDYDLWISGHYDGGGDQNRCMISAPDRATQPDYLNPEAQDKSEEFCRIWKDIYPRMTGAINRDDMITEGMKDYYAFDYVPLDTPAVIVEHFNGTSDKGKQLKANPDIVANADAEAILKFLDLLSNSEEDSLRQCLAQKDNLEKEIDSLKLTIKELQEQIGEKDKRIADYQSKLRSADERVVKYREEKDELADKLNKCQTRVSELVDKAAEEMTIKELIVKIIDKIVTFNG